MTGLLDITLDQVLSEAREWQQFNEDRDIGYHYGDGGVARDTTLHRMDAGRSTGHLGTGVYFYGKRQEKGEGRAHRPHIEIDLSDKNLAKPLSGDGLRLHNALRDFNRVVFKKEGEFKKDAPASSTMGKFLFGMGMALGFRHEDKVLKAAQKVKRLFDTGKNDGFRTPSTYLMQELGYDGVDMRGTNADHGDIGSVLYVRKIGKDLVNPVPTKKVVEESASTDERS